MNERKKNYKQSEQYNSMAAENSENTKKMNEVEYIRQIDIQNDWNAMESFLEDVYGEF